MIFKTVHGVLTYGILLKIPAIKGIFTHTMIQREIYNLRSAWDELLTY